MAVWATTAPSSPGIRTIIFDRSGTILVPEFGITNVATDLTPQVTALANGGFVATYQGNGVIYACIFDANQNAMGNEFVVSARAAAASQPATTALTNGGFVVSWSADGGDGHTYLWARTFNAAGTQTGADRFLGEGSDVHIAALPTGGWVFAYTTAGLDITSGVVLANGGSSAGTIYTANAEYDPDITVLDNGFYVVSWTFKYSSTDTDIYYRVYDPDGGIVPINGSYDPQHLDSSAVNGTNASVSAIAAGRFITAWQDDQADSNYGRISASVQEVVRATTGDGTSETLTGDALRDNLNGGGGNDILIGLGGNDQLNGGAGADAMRGGAGNDIYIVDNAGDVVDESAAGSNGTDQVSSSVLSINLSDALHYKGTIENAVLQGASNLNLVGNGLANALTGNAGNNTLNGGAGADILRGMGGNDNYVVDNAGDIADESIAGSGGTDAIYSSAIAINLGDTAHYRGSIENAVLQGSSNLNLIGNSLNNLLVGNSGNNVFDGKLGADTMVGGAGNDVFRFDTALGGGNVDRINDYAVVNDQIQIDNAVFTGLANGALAAAAFFTGTAAHDADDRIIYNSATGALFFDSDGTGGTAQIQFATLSAGLAMAAGEFAVI